MTTTLNTNNLIPLNSNDAYSTVVYGYTASIVASIPNASIVDWVLMGLELEQPQELKSLLVRFLKK